VRRILSITLALTLGACESATDVYAELHPELLTHLAAIDAARDAVRLAPPPEPIVLPVASPVPRFCPTPECRPGPRGEPIVNARVVQLMDLEVPPPGPLAGAVPVAGRCEWLAYARALAAGPVDPRGRPLGAWYGPALRDVLHQTLDLRYLLIVRGGVELDPWIELRRTAAVFPLRLVFEEATDVAHPDREAPTFVDGRLAGDAILADLDSGELLGGVTFEASTYGNDDIDDRLPVRRPPPASAENDRTPPARCIRKT